MASIAPSIDEYAVMTMTGRYGLAMRIARSVSMPLMPGSITSRMTRSIASSVSRIASACSPLDAMTTSKPSRRRTASSTSRRTSSSSTMSMRIDLNPSVLPDTTRPWQRNRELRSVAGCALHADLSVARVQNPAGNGQTEPGPALPAFGGDQRLENPAGNFRRNSFAVVFHPDLNAFSVVGNVDPDVAMLANRIASIDENVGENLLEIVKVPAHLRLWDLADMHRDLFRFEEVLVKRHRGVDQRGNGHRVLRPRPIGDEVEQIVDERRRAEGLLLHFFQQPVFRIVLRHVFEEQLRVGRDARQRRVDLVCDARGKQT